MARLIIFLLLSTFTISCASPTYRTNTHVRKPLNVITFQNEMPLRAFPLKFEEKSHNIFTKVCDGGRTIIYTYLEVVDVHYKRVVVRVEVNAKRTYYVAISNEKEKKFQDFYIQHIGKNKPLRLIREKDNANILQDQYYETVICKSFRLKRCG